MKKSKLIKDQYSRDADENDSYLAKMEEIAKDHPEIRPELDSFRIYIAGFTNGVLKQVKEFYSMIEGVKEFDGSEEEKKGKQFLRDSFECVDGISFKAATKFKPKITLEMFIDNIDQMRAAGEIPKGTWEDETYIFDKSHFNDWRHEIIEEDLRRAKNKYFHEKRRLKLNMSPADYEEHLKKVGEEPDYEVSNKEFGFPVKCEEREEEFGPDEPPEPDYSKGF